MGSTLNPTIELRQVAWPSGAPVEDTFCLATPSVTYKSTPSSSTDPFSGKTNKYAESKVIEVVSAAKGVHIRFGASDVGAATTSYYYIPVDTPKRFSISDDAKYVRIIEAASAATVYVTEIY